MPGFRFSLCTLFISLNLAAQEMPAVKQDTMFPAELRHTINSKSAIPGDPVEFRTLEPVLLGNNVVVTTGATLLGEVEQALPRSDSSPESSISIRVRELRWNGKSVPLNAVVSGVFFVRSSYTYRSGLQQKPTFLEGIEIVAHLSETAFTEFSCRKKDVVLRNGILLMFREIDPAQFRPVIVNQLAAKR